MEPLDWEDEFRPLDEDRTQYLVQVAAELMAMAKNPTRDHNEASVLGVASYQILRLTAMATAGFSMYQDLRVIADDMASELATITDLLNRHGNSLGSQFDESVARFKGHVKSVNDLFSELS